MSGFVYWALGFATAWVFLSERQRQRAITARILRDGWCKDPDCKVCIR